jgi:hypothetical protein
VKRAKRSRVVWVSGISLMLMSPRRQRQLKKVQVNFSINRDAILVRR